MGNDERRSIPTIEVPDLSNWKQHKVSIRLGSVVILFAALWGLHEYTASHLSGIFLSSAAAEELTTKVEQALNKANSNTTMMLSFMRRQELKDARSELSGLRGQLQETLLWESANQPNAISRDRKADLEEEIDQYETFIRCLETGRDNCVF